MGWFTKKCPRCGGPLQETGYSIGCPAYRCRNCIRNNRIKNDQERRIEEIKKRLDQLESKI